MQIESMTAARAADWLEFFDETAFADNPEWAGCYCRVFEFPHDRENWDQACAMRANRAVMADAAASGRVQGYLAYGEDGRVIGWCRFGMRGRYRTGHSGILSTDAAADASTAAALCFVIAPDFRRRGIARALLEHACKEARAAAFLAVEGYALKEVPVDDGLPAEAELFRGPRALFDGLGFVVAGETDRYWIMRLALRGS